MIYILGGIAIFGFIMYAMILAVPKTDEEQKQEDEEQMKYIKKWKEEYNKS